MNTFTKTFLSAAIAATTLTAFAAEHAKEEHAKPDLTKLPPAAATTGLTFEKDIKAMLEKSCHKCHSGDRPKSKYSMESLETIIKGGKEGKGIVPGKSTESPVLLYAAETVEEMEMPPLDKREKFPALTKEQLGTLRAWIDQGAK
jgi:hypothetical protein